MALESLREPLRALRGSLVLFVRLSEGPSVALLRGPLGLSGRLSWALQDSPGLPRALRGPGESPRALEYPREPLRAPEGP